MRRSETRVAAQRCGASRRRLPAALGNPQFLAFAVFAAAWMVSMLLGCRPSQIANSSPEHMVSRRGNNPFVGLEGFVTPYSHADQAVRRLRDRAPRKAALLEKISRQPQAVWFGGWTQGVEIVVRNYVRAAARARQLPLLVAYNIPHRDCGQYSGGGAASSAAYREWIRQFARGIGDLPAVVILEPDAVAQLDDCLSSEDQQERLKLLAEAVATFSNHSGTDIYIDAGHSRWQPVEVITSRLRAAGVDRARGFSLNVSNFVSDAPLIEYGNDIAQRLGEDTFFVIDSSRNGKGPAPGSGEATWCNPAGRALGKPPTVDSGQPKLDAFVWVKRPGESDGRCNGGPPAGEWFEQSALELAEAASW